MSENAINLEEFPSDFSESEGFDDIPLEYRDFFIQLSDRLGGEELISALADWIVRNTRLPDRRFSFKDHEFQIDIANDRNENACVKKCSQVGLSELTVRITLGLLALAQGRSGIYVLPSEKFAGKFSKTRFNPVIESSRVLTSLLIAGNNGALMKRLGRSILYLGGASSASQAISIPADILIVDEFDFCVQEVMTAYNSRLRHSLHPFRRFFSTPTVSNFGISHKYDLSDQKVYMVKCMHCAEWQNVDLFAQIFVPGFSEAGRSFKEFMPEDVVDPAYRVDESYIQCIKCKRSLDMSLAQSELRRWVRTFTERTDSGYHVKPTDLITYNPTHKIVKQRKEYSREQDYFNFVLGETCDSNENSINNAVFVKNRVLVPLSPEMAVASAPQGLYMGVDVGKTCHIMVGKPGDKPGKVDVLWAQKVRSTDGKLFDQIKKLYEQFNIYRAVIDAGPDFTLSQGLHDEFGEWFHQCVYIRGGERHIKYLEIKDEDTNVVSVVRVKGFDALVQAHNRGLWRWPNMPEVETEVARHMQGMKRVETLTEDGEKKPKWVTVAEAGLDHYMHAAMYLKTAIDIDELLQDEGQSVPAPLALGGVSVGRLSPSALLAAIAERGNNASTPSDSNAALMRALMSQFKI